MMGEMIVTTERATIFSDGQNIRNMFTAKVKDMVGRESY